MSEPSLAAFSNQLADVIAHAAPSVVQVHGRRRPASGVVYGPDLVITTARALGQEDGIKVRDGDGRTLDAELRGWDPATNLVLLRVPGLALAAAAPPDREVRVGHIAIAIGRSWSNALTATTGIVSVIGGPLPTGRGRAIDRVIRTTAPMHGGFAGGAVVDATGRLMGIGTAAEIRGLGVVIPADIAWATARTLAEHGTVARGYLGIAGQPAKLSGKQRDAEGRGLGLLIVEVSAGSPADTAGLLVGDVVTTFDGHPVQSPEDLLALLEGDRVGRTVAVRVLRGGAPTEIAVAVGTRTTSR